MLIIFSIVLGVLVLGEPLAWNDDAGFVLILVGIMIINGLGELWQGAYVLAMAE